MSVGNNRAFRERLGALPVRTEFGRAGVTLLEMMVVIALIAIVIGMLSGMAIALGDTARVQNVRVTAADEARRAMQVIAQEVRQAAKSTLSNLPASSLTYCVAVDSDGNGYAVDVGGDLELSAQRTIERDTADANGDGVTGTQLILRQGGQVRVLANQVLADEDANGNGALDLGEDANGNGVLDRGVWFERAGNAIRVTVQMSGRTRKGTLSSSLTETVLPRN